MTIPIHVWTVQKKNPVNKPGWHSCSIYLTGLPLFFYLKSIDMKLKTFFAVAAIAIFAACGTPYQATNTGNLVVPDRAQASLVEQYPNGTNIVWSYYDPTVVIVNDWELTGWQILDESDYVAKFDMDNEQYYAWFDSNGEWIGTAYLLRDHASLPSYVRTTLTSQYPAYTISSVGREFYKDRNLYEVVMKNNDSKVVLLVDNDGNVVKSKVKPL